jgi:hypothetical protein
MHAGRVFVALLTVVLLAAPGRAQVDCSDPDNLCTGDPCVIPALELPSDCTVDFGTRTVVILGRLRQPAEGVLDFSAGAFTVSGGIVNRRAASATQRVTLQATGNIVVDSTIRLRGAGAFITLDAGGDLSWSRRISAGGTAGGGYAMDVLLRAAGDVTADGRVDVSNTGNTAGTIQIEAGGRLTAAGRIKARQGDAILRGATELHVLGTIDVRGFATSQSLIELTSTAGPVTVDGTVLANGSAVSQGLAGSVIVTASGDVVVNGRLLANGDAGGEVAVSSSSGGVAVNGRVSASGGDGGLVTLSAATLASVDGTIDASGDNPASSGGGAGTIDITGAEARLGAGGLLTATSVSRPGGTIGVSATAGDLLLAGRLLAGTGESSGGNSLGGTIEGDASGDLTASGVFECLDAAVSGGCIGLSAGGTLDTSGGTFDKPIVASCP